MDMYLRRVVALLPFVALAGCATPPAAVEPNLRTVVVPRPEVGIVRAGYTSPGPGDASLPPPKKPPAVGTGVTPQPAAGDPTVGLPDLIRMAVEQNPRLARVGWAVETARGRAVQAGLYPNPTLSVTGDELGDRTGPGGIWTAPYFSQEIVTGDKLGLSRAAALKEVDQATLAVVAERYRVFTEVRQNYYEVVTLQRRAEVLSELVALAERTVENANTLRKAKEIAEIDVIQLDVDLERYRAELEATRRTLPAAFRRLVSSAGVPDLPYAAVTGSLDAPLPDYDLDRVRAYVVGIHPEVRSAQIGVERARLAVKRATVEPIPNVTLGTGYIRQNQNKSDDWVIAASIPVPLFNRNQGNILSAKGQLGEAVADVGRAQNDLVARVATAFATYAAARDRAGRYKTAILPKARDSYQLSLKAYQGGQFEYLRVLQAQRAVAEANLEYLRSLGEAWRAAGEVSGLMLEDEWPVSPVNPRVPDRGP